MIAQKYEPLRQVWPERDLYYARTLVMSLVPDPDPLPVKCDIVQGRIVMIRNLRHVIQEGQTYYLLKFRQRRSSWTGKTIVRVCEKCAEPFFVKAAAPFMTAVQSIINGAGKPTPGEIAPAELPGPEPDPKVRKLSLFEADAYNRRRGLSVWRRGDWEMMAK